MLSPLTLMPKIWIFYVPDEGQLGRFIVYFFELMQLGYVKYKGVAFTLYAR